MRSSPLAQPAVGQQEHDLAVGRLLALQHGERCRGVGNLAQLVIRQGHVQADMRVLGAALERFTVLGDGLAVTSRGCQGDAQIGAGVHRVGTELQVRLVLRDGPVQLAGLVQRNCLLQDRLRILLRGRRMADQHQGHY